MTEWWTYHLSDFLLFSSATYRRLFELYNAALWPAQPVVAAASVGLIVGLLRQRPWAPRATTVALGLAWLWTAWAFHLQRYATINWAATWFAGAFAAQGLLLLASSVASMAPVAPGPPVVGTLHRVGLILLLYALVGPALLIGAQGVSWQQTEVLGLAPDPTTVGTLGLLLMLPPARTNGRPGAPRWQWALWPIPLLWCGISGATLWAMHRPDALVLPVAAALALLTAWRGPRPGWRALPD